MRDIEILKLHIRDLINVSGKLPDYGIFSLSKIIAAYEIIDNSESYIFTTGKDPISEVIKSIDVFKNIFNQLIILNKENSIRQRKTLTTIRSMDKKQIEVITSQIYGDLWRDFSEEKFYDEAFKSLTDRLERNDIDINWFKGKRCLDAGCGGGRYSVALKRLGAEKVVGIDMAERGLLDAQKRIKKLKIKNVFFKKGNVLNISFPKENFDFVLSNGVLHHTVNTEKGISEISRVLKRGGKIFIYLGGKGGLDWDLFYLGRKLLKNISKEQSILTLKALGLSGNRIFYFIDPLYVLIQNWTTPEKLEAWLDKYDFTNITRLYRGTDYDRNEYIFNPKKAHKYAAMIYGCGDLRYIADKK